MTTKPKATGYIIQDYDLHGGDFGSYKISCGDQVKPVAIVSRNSKGGGYTVREFCGDKHVKFRNMPVADTSKEQATKIMAILNGVACTDAEGSTPDEHEYAFDIMLDCPIRVKASSPEEALKLIRGTLDCASANLGSWPDGDPILTEVSFSHLTPPSLYEIDGESV